MSENLNDWLGNNIWAWWALFAILLASTNLVVRSRTASTLAIGAGAAGLTALLAPGAYLAQGLVGLLVLLLVGVVLRRPAIADRG